MTTRERIRELWESGVASRSEIARQVGASREYVGQTIGRKKDRAFNVIAACREIREELERPITFVLDQTLDPERGFRHGTVTAYQYHDCRCVLCRLVPMEKRAEAIEKFARGEHRPTHGKSSTYTVYGCRCDACRAAGTEAHRPHDRRRRERERQRRSA